MTSPKWILAGVAGLAAFGLVWFGFHAAEWNSGTTSSQQKPLELKHSPGSDAKPTHKAESVPSGRTPGAIKETPVTGPITTGLSKPNPTASVREPEPSSTNIPSAVPPETSGSAQSGSPTQLSGGFSGSGLVPASPSPGSFASGVGYAGPSPSSDFNIPVPLGGVIPAAFLDETPRPAPQQRALDRIMAEFNESVGASGGRTASPEVWRKAKEVADNHYKTLFGFKKYNEMHIKAAREAVREKKAINASAPQP